MERRECSEIPFSLLARISSFFVHVPDQEVYSDEGSDITLEWDFRVASKSPSAIKVHEFLFGEWADPGYVNHKILSVQGYNKVYKRRGFEKKVGWSGNIYRCTYCTAKVTMYNLTRADFKKYGVDIELGLEWSPLEKWLKLVKRVPASIVKWLTKVQVYEGNATTIECQAKGLPTPFVALQRYNRTLCNETKRCAYKIQAAKPEHQGEYVCLAQQKNDSQISRSMHLTVHQVERLTAVKSQSTNMQPQHHLHKLVIVGVVVGVLILCVALVMFAIIRAYLKRKRAYGAEEERNALKN